jgi:thiol-disulfide isomerase/thioredoxin
MKLFPRFCLLTTCAVALLANDASAQQRDPGEMFLRKRFEQLDLDHDGRLTAEEAKPVSEWVKGADADGDGYLTIEEIGDNLRDRFTELFEAARGLQVTIPPKLDELAPPFVSAKDSPREEPRRLKAGDCGIGALIPDIALPDLDGKSHALSEITAHRPTVIALISSSCPVSKRYFPTLGQLEKEYGAKGVAFLFVASNPTDAPADLRAAGFAAPIVRDPENKLQQALGVRSTTDAFVLDAARTLQYRGAIDDQYGIGYSLDAPRQRYLTTALDAVLAGRTPDIAATDAPGCALDISPARTAATNLTYHNRISRLVQANCQECHRSGGIAPFALETYEQVVAKSGMIRKMVERQLMPPWFAAPPATGQHSLWKNDRSLSERDRTDLLAWLNAGKIAGDPKDAPLPRTFPKDWQIGTPDLIVQIPNPIAIKADGTMPYQNVTVETSLTEDKWVRGFEIQPTAREVVHHVLVFLQTPGGGERTHFEGEEDERSGFFAAYVPGNNHVIYPDGFAKKLPAGTRMRFQIHYTPNGTATADQVKLGMIFAKEAPQHIVRVAGIPGHRLKIPPGADNHPESALLPVPQDAVVLGFTPHMHVRGKAFRYEVILPDGAIRTLLDVPRYDFNWQLTYRYAEPPTLPSGSKIRATGWFDNSVNNPANPDPTKTVRWGLQTFEEMMLGYVEYYFPSETPSTQTASLK